MEYKKRVTAPSANNKYYRHVNYGGLNSCIHIKNGSCLPNCVGYAWGRQYETTGEKPKLSRGNAENWYDYNDGYKRGKTPKVGAVICWRKGKAGDASDGAGHVAFVEEVYSDGSILTSNSAYGGSRFYTKKLKAPNYKMGSKYTFQGFIYNPIEFEEPKTNEITVDGVWGKGTTTRAQEVFGTTKDGIVSNQSSKCKKYLPNASTTSWEFKDKNYKAGSALIKAIQKKIGASVDGVFGKKSVKKLQKFLGVKADGSMGPDTVKAFQKWLNEQ